MARTPTICSTPPTRGSSTPRRWAGTGWSLRAWRRTRSRHRGGVSHRSPTDFTDSEAALEEFLTSGALTICEICGPPSRSGNPGHLPQEEDGSREPLPDREEERAVHRDGHRQGGEAHAHRSGRRRFGALLVHVDEGLLDDLREVQSLGRDIGHAGEVGPLVVEGDPHAEGGEIVVELALVLEPDPGGGEPDLRLVRGAGPLGPAGGVEARDEIAEGLPRTGED